MLQDFRDNIRGVTATILVAIIIIPFAFWGVESLFISGASVDQAASVNGEKITELEVLRGIDIQKQQLLSRFSDIDPKALDEQLLRAPVLDYLIRQRLLTATARASGMAVPDQTFTEIIVNSENFQQEGRFDPAFYEYQLSRMGYTPRDYQQLVMNEMLASQLNAGIQASGLITDHQVKTFGRLALQQRDYAYVHLKGDDAGEVAVSDAEVMAYYTSRGDEFVLPDQVVLEYIELNPELLANTVSVDDEQIAARIKAQHESEQGSATTWQLAHILVEEGGDELLADIQSRLAAGEEFADLAQEHSVDFGSAEQGGDLGTFTVESLPEGFGDAIAELDVGAVSAPVATDSGVHLIKVLARSETSATPVDQDPEQVAAALRRELALEQMPAMLDRLKDETYSVDSLASASEALGLPVAVTAPFSQDGGEGIARQPDVVAVAFSEDILEHGYASDVLEIGADQYVVVKLKEFIASHKPELGVVRERIAVALKGQKVREQLTARGQQVLARLKAGEALENIAADEGVELERVAGAMRFDQRSSPELGDAIFKHPSTTDLPVHDMVAGAGEVYVYSLTAMGGSGAEALSAEERQAMQLSLAQLNGQREYLAYLETLVTGAEISKRK